MVDINEIRAALDDATWGNWRVHALGPGDELRFGLVAKLGDGADGKTYYICVDDAYVSDAKDDAHMIANSRKWLKELCDEVSRLDMYFRAQAKALIAARAALGCEGPCGCAFPDCDCQCDRGAMMSIGAGCAD